MKIVNEPASIDIDFYHNQIELYKSRVAKLPGVQAIYLMGSIKAPGLSDIDLVVVVDDDFDAKISEKLSVNGLDSSVFLHGPIVIPESLAGDLQSIFYASNLRCIYGKGRVQDWSDLSGQERDRLSVCYLIDFIESRLVQFCRIGSGPIDKRSWLTRIWSTIHSLDLYRGLMHGFAFDEVPSLEDDIRRTRSQWLEYGFVSDNVFAKGLKASVELNRFIFCQLLDQYYGSPVLSGGFEIICSQKKLIFENEICAPLYDLKDFSLFNRRLMLVVGRHNPSYLAHLQAYLGKSVAWKVFPKENEELRQMRERRANLVFRHANWLMLYAPRSGALSGYLGVDSYRPRGVKNAIKKSLVYFVS